MTVFERFGLKDNPYTTDPVTYNTLNLFVGRKEEIKRCFSATESKSIIVVEGGRGVGTTSFGNYIRFTRWKKKENFTVSSELSVAPGWNREFLLAHALAWLVGSLEKYEEISKSPKFRNIKRATHGVEEVFKNLGIQLISLGAQYGKQMVATTPSTYPSATLIQHLQDLSKIIEELGYKKNTILQINNLDVDTTISSEQLRFFLNDIRDLLQIPGYSWLLVGDTGLRSFITSNVDRVDDIITLEVYIKPLTLNEVYEVIDRRLEFLKFKESVEAPITNDVIDALYHASNGRIRQIFGTATRLLHLVADDPMYRKINLEDAVPLLETLVEEKIHQYGIDNSPATFDLLRKLAKYGPITPTELSKKIGARRPLVSRALLNLKKARLANFERRGKEHFWDTEPDVKIALTKGATYT